MTKNRQLIVEDLGIADYQLVWKYQQELVSARKIDNTLPDILVLVEHPPVYTLGTGANTQFIHFDLADPAYRVCRVERGGEVTYHCPGQLVGYPILNLKYHQQDLHWYLRQLECLLIDVLAHFDLRGYRIDGLTGVWLEAHKVAAIGIKVSRWITMHGFALNVCPDLSGFSKITPCGIADYPVGSMTQFMAGIGVADVKPVLIRQLARIFDLWAPDLESAC